MVVTKFASAVADRLSEASSALAPAVVPCGVFELVGDERHLGRLEQVDVDGHTFRRALRISTDVGATQEWHVRLAANTTATIEADDQLLARFWVRCTATMTGQGVVGFVFEGNDTANKPLAERRLSVGAEWVECFVPFRASQRIAAGEARLCFDVGYDRQ